MEIASSAIVTDCSIGTGTVVWHYANLYRCSIGRKCTIGAFVEIANDVVVHDNVTISSHSYLCPLTEIEDDVFIGHGVMTINDIHPPSQKRTGTSAFWKPLKIGRGAIIGSNATLFPINIGENAVIGAGAVVTKDVPAGQTVVGNPAKLLG